MIPTQTIVAGVPFKELGLEICENGPLWLNPTTKQ